MIALITDEVKPLGLVVREDGCADAKLFTSVQILREKSRKRQKNTAKTGIWNESAPFMLTIA